MTGEPGDLQHIGHRRRGHRRRRRRAASSGPLPPTTRRSRRGSAPAMLSLGAETFTRVPNPEEKFVDPSSRVSANVPVVGSDPPVLRRHRHGVVQRGAANRDRTAVGHHARRRGHRVIGHRGRASALASAGPSAVLPPSGPTGGRGVHPSAVVGRDRHRDAVVLHQTRRRPTGSAGRPPDSGPANPVTSVP